MINVTKSYLPNLKEFQKYITQIWDRGHLTNHGPLVLELEDKLRKFLSVKHVFLLNNGTIAIQIAIKALELKGEIITTPFSYVATTSSIVWEGCKPVFADIDPLSLTLDPKSIEKKITDKTEAIMATHVYGIPCDVKAIEEIANKHKLKVIYDAAHAFGVEYDGKGLLNYGDVSTLSFHATKLFHTIEGGAVVTNDDEIAHKLSYMRNFGHNGPEAFFGVGINGKTSEVNAAMGLCVLPKISEIIGARKKWSDLYTEELSTVAGISQPVIPESTEYNYAYFPILFENEEQLLKVRDELNAVEIFPRRYFYPSLNTLHYLDNPQACPNSEDISTRVLCLPLFYDLGEETVRNICSIIKRSF